MQIGFLDFYGSVLNVRQDRADLIANNIANADTPNYKAVDVSFDSALASQLGKADGSAEPQYRADGIVNAAANGEAMEASTTFLHQSTTDLVTALRPNPSGN
jgi:flagellar basal-body rod protein FlgB